MSRPQYFEVSTNSPVEMGDTMGEYYFDSAMEDYGGRETTASLDRIRRIYWGHLDAIRRESSQIFFMQQGVSTLTLLQTENSMRMLIHGRRMI